jgi:pyruvate kinase
MSYELIATLGPGSATPEIWDGMLAAGATALRVNTSHVTLAELDGWLEKVWRWRTSRALALPLVLDLQGSKWRLGDFAALQLEDGQPVELAYGETSQRSGTLPVPHEDFFRAAPLSNGELALNDAKIRLRIEKQQGDTLLARVTQGGMISPRKGITYVASDFRVENISAKDQSILERTRGLEAIRYALSYIKDDLEMQKYRLRFGAQAYLIAKLERGPALADAAAIDASADELWLCRGDLGAELGLRAMAEAVAAFSAQIANLNRPVIMAGQVLEHMVEQPTPTRSEVCYLYDTLARGYHGFVLSDEAAIGRYPVESCRVAAMYK